MQDGYHHSKGYPVGKKGISFFLIVLSRLLLKYYLSTLDHLSTYKLNLQQMEWYHYVWLRSVVSKLLEGVRCQMLWFYRPYSFCSNYSIVLLNDKNIHRQCVNE